MSNGKGDAPRSGANQQAYRDGWDRVYGKQPKQEPKK